ncbi:polysaccharide deacetylase family protein [Roseobacter sinensis]|uniref:Chitooligosaccharide deacetylase n=1 Tax=Roseobacter sinensis TaxID=2931391 RepID=A0ABT3BIQ3_9RHOB|nr:polysaccharide deacetylase family protein [Roseobacter sp. WL0113]MCV3273456.1 polysaccharide deacetylase family protein [Roseobacter sp. WL0113]
MSERDLIGYGATPPEIVWPNGSRVAVSVVVNFEEGAECQVGDGDRTSERVGEIVSVVPDGLRDQGQEQLFAYGSRVGLWRFLSALEKTETPATFYMCGRAVARSPDLARAIVDAGHEAACHGWLWQPHASYTCPEEERGDLHRATEAIEAATGQRPSGFFCRGSESPWTRSMLAEAGYLYTSNAFDDDLPYHDPSGLTVVPYNLDTNDMKFFHPNGFVRAAEMVDYVTDAVEQLLREAEGGRSATLSIGFHLRICGRPARFPAVTGILEYLASLDGQIWRAQRHQIARHFAASSRAAQHQTQQGAVT